MWKYNIHIDKIPSVELDAMVTILPNGKLIPTDNPSEAIGIIWVISESCDVTINCYNNIHAQLPVEHIHQLIVPLSNILGPRMKWIREYEERCGGQN